MTTHLIEALLPGPLGLEVELEVLLDFPIILRPIKRTNDRAPDYRLESGDEELGFGWSKTSPVSGISYVAVVISRPNGTRLSGIAWQWPEQTGRWCIQVQEVCTVKFHA